jgi:hypothetical protein
MKFVKILISACLLLVCFSSVNAQICGIWNISVAVADETGEPVRSANVKFENVPENDAARDVKFSPTDGEEHTFAARFFEGAKVSNVYTIRVSAQGFEEKQFEIGNRYCKSSQNRIMLTSNGKPRVNFEKLSVLSGHFSNNKNRNVVFLQIEAKDGTVYYPTTDYTGFYSIKLKPGVYKIQINLSSCDDYTYENLKIEKNDVIHNIRVNCKL